MNTIKSTLFCILFCVSSQIIVACKSISIVSSPSDVVSDAVNAVTGTSTPLTSRKTPSQTPSPTYVYPATSTPYPTLTVEDQKALFALFHSKECRLPCYLGITPGETSFDEAKTILSSVGARASILGNYDINGLSVYEYSLYLGAPETPEVLYEVDKPGIYNYLFHNIILVVENDVVQRVEAYGQADRFSKKYYEYWSEYSVVRIFETLRIPDEILVHTITPWRKGAVYIYENPRVVVEIMNNSEGNQICPALEHQSVLLWLTLTAPDSSLGLYTITGGVSPIDSKYWAPIEDVLGVSEAKFYERVLNDPSICFDIRND